jgi:hypothetical protein
MKLGGVIDICLAQLIYWFHMWSEYVICYFRAHFFSM